MNEILVIAPESLTGSRFVELLAGKFELFGAGFWSEINSTLNLAGYDDLDITNLGQVERVLDKVAGQVVINFAGATDVGAIEKTRPSDVSNQNELDRNLAYRINVLGTRNILQAAQKTGKLPIFISTDFVFDGHNGPYSEDDELAKSAEEISWYGWTKLLAEKEVRASTVKSLTLRISYPYRREFNGKGDFARNFLKLYDKFKNGQSDSIHPIFTDQMFTPTFIDDIPGAVEFLLQKQEKGFFNLAATERTNFYDFFGELLKVARGVEEVEQIIPKGSIHKYFQENPDKPKWPIDGGLRSDKIIGLGLEPTGWRKGIAKAFS